MIDSNILLLLATGTLLLLNGIISSRAQPVENEASVEGPGAIEAQSPAVRPSEV